MAMNNETLEKKINELLRNIGDGETIIRSNYLGPTAKELYSLIELDILPYDLMAKMMKKLVYISLEDPSPVVKREAADVSNGLAKVSSELKKLRDEEIDRLRPIW